MPISTLELHVSSTPTKRNTYGLTSLTCPNFFFASSVETVGGTTTSSPGLDEPHQPTPQRHLAVHTGQANLHPVNRCSDALPISRLQTIHDPQDLPRVAARTRRIHHRQPNLLTRIDDENRADGERDALLVDVRQVLRVHHVVQPRHVPVGVGDDGELQLRVADFVDVADPAVV